MRSGSRPHHLREDHLARRVLQDARHLRPDDAAHHRSSVLDDDHRAVVEIAYTLSLLAPFAEHLHLDLLAGQHGGLHGAGEHVDVEDPDALDLGHLAEVEVGRQDVGAAVLTEAHELAVDVVEVVVVVVGDLDVVAHGHQLADHVEPPPSAAALLGVGRVGDALQLGEHEARDDQAAAEKAAFDDADDAPVDDHAGVDDVARTLAGRAVAAGRVETHQPQQLDRLARGEVGKGVAEDDEQRQQEVLAVGQTDDRQAREGGDRETDDEADRAHHDLGGRALGQKALHALDEPREEPTDHAPQNEADEPAQQRQQAVGDEAGAVRQKGETVVALEVGGGLVAGERAEHREHEPDDLDEHGSLATRRPGPGLRRPGRPRERDRGRRDAPPDRPRRLRRARRRGTRWPRLRSCRERTSARSRGSSWPLRTSASRRSKGPCRSAGWRGCGPLRRPRRCRRS